MMISPVLGIVAGAGTYAAAMYLEAKYNIQEDLKAMNRMKRVLKSYENAERLNRISMWYEVERRFKEYWNERAVWTREGTFTFGDCYARIVQYANWLLQNGIGPGDAVAVYMKNSPDFIFIWLSAVCIGAFPALLNANLEGESLLHCLKIAAPRLLLVSQDEDCQERIMNTQVNALKDEIKTIVVDEEVKKEVSTMPKCVPEGLYRDKVTGDQPFCLVYTSGTTGRPKACKISHRRFRMSGFHLEASFGCKPGYHVWYNPMPLYHGTGGFICVGTLLSGVGIALAPRFSVSTFWNDVYDSGATHFIYVGETARYLLNAPAHPLERSHKLICAHGNGLRSDIWQRFQTRFNIPQVAEFYNSTEGMMGLLNWSRGPYRVGSIGHHGLIRRMSFHNIYVPIKINTESGDIWRDPKTKFARRVSYEEGGEMLVAVPNRELFGGYWKDDEATEAKYVTDVFRKGDLYFRTGDALRRSSDGLWCFLDRLGDTFRWKSENVSTAEVSEAISQFDGILEANVYGVTLPNHEGRAGCAAIQLSSEFSKNPNYAALFSHLSDRLPNYAIPSFLRIVQKSSHTHNFKQSKVQLQKEGVNPRLIGSEAAEGANDELFWLLSKDKTYAQFTQANWDTLVAGKARL